MTVFGLDVSHHQNGQPNMAAAARDGIQFVFIKATEGANYRDPRWYTNVAEAQAAGMLIAAYHYVRADATAAAQVDWITKVVPRSIPVIPDVEANSGTVARLRDVVYLLQQAGYRVPLLYLPRWYWQQIGSPSLAGLPPLWSSRYPDTMVDDLRDEWARTPATYWAGYGGLSVEVLQFTSSARVAGYAPLDANAYRGTREQLSQLLYGTQEVERPMKNVKLVRDGVDHKTVWAGDGVVRRWVKDEKTLADYQWQIQQAGGDPTVQEWQNIDVLGAPLESMVGELTNDEANILAAVRAIPAGGVDEDALATALAPLIAPLIHAGATEEQVEAAMRRVFADAAQDAQGGQNEFAMPDLTGRTADEAQADLQALGWTGVLTTYTGGEGGQDDLNKVISQTPAAGATTATNAAVNITIATKLHIGG